MNYCVGFIFNKDLTKVLLVKKNRGPECVKNKLNGIGGKIEKTDSFPLNAISRECLEETGLNFHPAKWNYFCELTCNEGIIYFYYIVTDEIYKFKQVEDEIIKIYNLKIGEKYNNEFGLYQDYQVVANVNWLIPMALNHYKKLDPTKTFIIKELF